MWQGVPPVILPYGGLPDLVLDGETGRIVAPEAYSETIRELVLNPQERARLGANARAYAQEHFGSDQVAVSLDMAYTRAMRFEKHVRAWRGETFDARFAGASAFIESIGEFAAPYRASVAASDADEIRAAEKQIAFAPPVESGLNGGGLLDYRNAYAQDAMLRLWTGLVLGQAERFALAAAEFSAARALGLAEARVNTYIRRVSEHQTPFENAS
jgi:hypothetical protein